MTAMSSSRNSPHVTARDEELSEDAQAALRLIAEALRGLDTLSVEENLRVSGIAATIAVARLADGQGPSSVANALLDRVEAVVQESRRKW